ncbi:translocation/assembly module TamB domain-containing protein [Piscinibacter sp. HJYY11]|uniref:translocation/assembly module TamB domain-containing protein n=1 Tax=Piscinibacter sp. HJYY11 TaxID=2801333 RepID=UPI00191D98E8|nr:translocation/assembly module TamB domain-containing protein [Piscinibacter sp. HJYY11]MBL0730402.1 translocation/assembly module TamB domain-containing protein [Piscinibacter sp. HJYY11]
MDGNTEAPAPPPPSRRRRRGLWWSLASVAALCALLAGALYGLYWATGTTAGSQWLIARLALVGVNVQVSELEGALRGDFKAKQVVVTVGHTKVIVDRPVWRTLRIDYTHDAGVWARIHVASLVAERVEVTVESTGESTPFKLPRNLHLPVELQVDEVQARELHVPGLAGHPFRDVRGAVHLGHDRGRSHRFERLSGRLDPLLITGHARIDTLGPMAMDVDLKATQSAQGLVALPPWAKALRTDWQAEAQSKGPLARFDLRAKLRAQGQSLDASAIVAPESPWALPQLDAQTQGLDLSALMQQAPLTALDGTLRITPESVDKASTLTLAAKLENTKPGRWDQRQLPVRTLVADARWRSDQVDELSLHRFEATLADERRAAGTLQGTASWKGRDFAVDASLSKVQPSALDRRLMAMTLSGPLKLSGTLQPRTSTGAPAPPRFTALAELSGQLVDPPRPVQLRLDATGSEERIELRELRARADGASAELSGTADRASDGWKLKAQAALVDFDPKPWFPAGPRGGWRAGDHRFNLRGETTLHIADSVRISGPDDKRVLMERLAGLRGDAQVKLDNSVIASVPLTGELAWRHADGSPMQAKGALDVGGNRVALDGQLATDARGQQDRWTVEARAPALARVAPLLRAFAPEGQAAQMAETLTGSLTAEARATGRWPEISTQGNAALNGVRAGAWSVGEGQARWQVGSHVDAPLDVQVDIAQAAWSQRQIGATQLKLSGSGRQHQLTLRSEVRVAPPVWVENMQGNRTLAPPPVASPAIPPSAAARNAAAAAGPAPAERAPLRTLISASAQGSLAGNLLHTHDPRDTTPPWSWKGALQQIEVRTTQAGSSPLLSARDIGLELRGGPPMRASVSAGRADILGAGLKWSRIDWEAGRGVVTQQLDMQAELEPIAVAPLLRRMDPNFGWGGDLVIGGRVVLKQADTFTADVVLERVRGDLTVTEESGTQALGLTDLRLGLDARDGVWNFTAGLAGQTLGVLGGAVVVRTSPQLAWPAVDAPVQGVLEAQVANLGTWGAWVPAGWRLDGRLNISATLGGRFNAFEYTGKMVGAGIGVRNMVEGVNVTDGQVDISLDGDTARINTFSARAGNGTVRIEGGAEIDKKRANIKLVADKFQLLGRVDRRIVVTGEATAALDGESVKSDGRFTVDEGLVDFTLLSSPSLGDDVFVTGRRDAPPTTPPTGGDRVSLNLLVNLGNNLRMRGLGIDTKLRGELRVSRPAGKWHLAGEVNAVEGKYANYGQNLEIDRGVIVFNGLPTDMRLDIEATRPNLDTVRVGVKITGPLFNLRTRIFSEPEMTMNEKMSWLILGRASDGLGKTDAALVQRAAFALLAGEGDGGPAAITKAFGIDELGLRQTEGDTRETVVSVGKQLSKRIFVAYEQNLTTSTGSFQVTYRIAQRFVMRLQSGLDRSVDLIGTWRWE